MLRQEVPAFTRVQNSPRTLAPCTVASCAAAVPDAAQPNTRIFFPEREVCESCSGEASSGQLAFRGGVAHGCFKIFIGAARVVPLHETALLLALPQRNKRYFVDDALLRADEGLRPNIALQSMVKWLLQPLNQPTRTHFMQQDILCCYLCGSGSLHRVVEGKNGCTVSDTRQQRDLEWTPDQAETYSMLGICPQNCCICFRRIVGANPADSKLKLL